MSTPHTQRGFGNTFASEALAGALPAHQNSPQHCAYGLYAEQISGTAFTAPRHANRHTWLYRIRPAAMHGTFVPYPHTGMNTVFDGLVVSPNQLRWSALPPAAQPQDFIDSWLTLAGNGNAEQQTGCALHWYRANRDMQGRYFYDADGELLIIPQQGRLRIATELGVMEIAPQEIAVIPRGIRFQVSLPDGVAQGYLCENFGAPFRLPDLGVIGSNGLANPRDFMTPHAAYEDIEGDFTLLAKFANQLWSAEIDHSPLDVVAWHGNHVPYHYDLRHFNTIGSISYDHPDPSIFLVLQSISDTPGVDAIDFVIFPPRWLVAEHSFRPPWFHRNIASEWMGLIHGEYDAKADGFVPGGFSLHNCMSGHGPDAASTEKALDADTSQPQVLRDTMAFMIETRHLLKPTAAALALPQLQKDYAQCWRELPKRFST